jgi:hypothetical protein
VAQVYEVPAEAPIAALVAAIPGVPDLDEAGRRQLCAVLADLGDIYDMPPCGKCSSEGREYGHKSRHSKAASCEPHFTAYGLFGEAQLPQLQHMGSAATDLAIARRWVTQATRFLATSAHEIRAAQQERIASENRANDERKARPGRRQTRALTRHQPTKQEPHSKNDSRIDPEIKHERAIEQRPGFIKQEPGVKQCELRAQRARRRRQRALTDRQPTKQEPHSKQESRIEPEIKQELAVIKQEPVVKQCELGVQRARQRRQRAFNDHHPTKQEPHSKQKSRIETEIYEHELAVVKQDPGIIKKEVCVKQGRSSCKRRSDTPVYSTRSSKRLR